MAAAAALQSRKKEKESPSLIFFLTRPFTDWTFLIQERVYWVLIKFHLQSMYRLRVCREMRAVAPRKALNWFNSFNLSRYCLIHMILGFEFMGPLELDKIVLGFGDLGYRFSIPVFWCGLNSWFFQLSLWCCEEVCYSYFMWFDLVFWYSFRFIRRVQSQSVMFGCTSVLLLFGNLVIWFKSLSAIWCLT